MPLYLMKRNDTGEEYEVRLKMSEREEYIRLNNVTQLPTFPGIHSGRGMGKAAKPEEGFRDLLREIKKQNSKGLWVSTVNTFD